MVIINVWAKIFSQRQRKNKERQETIQRGGILWAEPWRQLLSGECRFARNFGRDRQGEAHVWHCVWLTRLLPLGPDGFPLPFAISIPSLAAACYLQLVPFLMDLGSCGLCPSLGDPLLWLPKNELLRACCGLMLTMVLCGHRWQAWGSQRGGSPHGHLIQSSLPYSSPSSVSFRRHNLESNGLTSVPKVSPSLPLKEES